MATRIMDVLTQPSGRIGRRDFWRGVVVLLGAMTVLQVASAFGPFPIAAIANVLSLAVPFGYVCVYGKRLHDAGQSAWLFVLFVVGYLIVSGLVSAVLTPLLAPKAVPAQQDFAAKFEAGDYQAAVEAITAAARLGMVPSLLTLYVSNAVIGFAAASLPPDPAANTHGPPQGRGQ